MSAGAPAKLSPALTDPQKRGITSFPSEGGGANARRGQKPIMDRSGVWAEEIGEAEASAGRLVMSAVTGSRRYPPVRSGAAGTWRSSPDTRVVTQLRCWREVEGPQFAGFHRTSARSTSPTNSHGGCDEEFTVRDAGPGARPRPRHDGGTGYEWQLGFQWFRHDVGRLERFRQEWLEWKLRHHGWLQLRVDERSVYDLAVGEPLDERRYLERPVTGQVES